VSTALAHAKINLALVVGPVRDDGMHEVATVLQRVELHDIVELEPAPSLEVTGFADTLATHALTLLADKAGVPPAWRVRIDKRIPVAAGLGGGSSDAAAALVLANDTLPEPLASNRLHEIGAAVGADVPFFLRDGPQLATGDGTALDPVELPRELLVVLVLPAGVAKESTRGVYALFDARNGATGFEERRAALDEALGRIDAVSDLSRLPRNDLASSPLAVRLEELGAIRADVSGAGPAVYGLFDAPELAAKAAETLRDAGVTILTRLA